jgi:hypothetical protein
VKRNWVVLVGVMAIVAVIGLLGTLKLYQWLEGGAYEAPAAETRTLSTPRDQAVEDIAEAEAEAARTKPYEEKE